MKYSIESEYHKCRIILDPKNALGYMNVPLVKSFLKHERTFYAQLENKRSPTVHVMWEDAAKTPVAEFQLEYAERGDEDLIKRVYGQSQTWLGREITRLEQLHTDMETLKEAYNGNA